MDKVKKLIKDDLWIVFMDIIAVNLSYYIALVLRGRIEIGFRYSEGYNIFIGIFLRYAPVYTVLCLVVFYMFRLYGGLWRYAGISDMNRIIVASLVTCVIYITGSLVYVIPTPFGHMPITYYGLGALFQFCFIFAIRFSYRILLIERRRSEERQNKALVVGAGELGRQVSQMLQNGVFFNVSCIVDTEDEHVGRLMDGIPVYDQAQFGEAVDKFNISCVFLAEPDLDRQAREQIKKICEAKGVEIRDYTSFFNFSTEMESDVPVVDATLSGGRKIPFSPPDISETEVAEVVETLESGWITTGPRTKLLERRLAAYIETGKTDIDTEEETDRWKERVACLNSATASEELNLRILGIRPGDEVIVPALTYTASASAAIHCGATVKFVDIQRDGDPTSHAPEMDYDALEAAITERTKAIIPVDFGGIVCDYDRIFAIVERKKALFKPLEPDGTPLGDLNSRIQKSMDRVAVVADCAHGLGANRVVGGKRKFCGAIADFTSFSFHAVKNFTTAEGGAATWLPIKGIENSEIYKMYQLLSLHGQNKDALAKTRAGAWEYDIIGPWYKCNMTDIMAAIGLRQLDRYKSLLSRRVEIMAKYDAVCDELGISHLIHHTSDMDSSNHLYLIRVPGIEPEQRNLIIEKMAEKGVATNVHYKPLPMMTAYSTLSGGIENYSNSYDYYHNLITLPLHTLLTDEDVEYVCECLTDVIREVVRK